MGFFIFMDREIGDRNILDAFCEQFCAVVERHCNYIVVSGFVAISSGRTRGTEDIDLIVERINLPKFMSLYSELLSAGFVCMQTTDGEEAYSYLKDNLSLRFTWRDKELPEMEMKFAKDLLDKYQLDTRVKLTLTGLDVWFSNVNVNIAFKEELLKSQKDLEDARHLRIVYGEMIDKDEIETVKAMIRRYRL